MGSYSPETIKRLESTAKQVRRDIIHMIATANAGHPGGSLSATDIVTALYFEIMKVDPKNPKMEDRDRFILSKGHTCPVLYAALAEKGYYPMKELDTLRRMHSILQGHPDMKKTPGVDMTSGALGTGLSVGIGMALAAKQKKLDYSVFVMLGDGEIQEGTIWEAAMAANHHKVNNLVAIIDDNGLQVDGYTRDIMDPSSIDAKFEAFGWDVKNIDGHNMEEILEALSWAKSNNKPSVIIAKTIKGKGVSFMEDVCVWHGLAPDAEQTKQAMAELAD